MTDYRLPAETRDALLADLDALASIAGGALSRATRPRSVLRGLEPWVDPTPEPPVDPDARPGWTLLHKADLTRDEGWTALTGGNSNNEGYNTPANRAFTPDGLVLTARREAMGGKPYTEVDVLGKHMSVPNYFRVEVETTLCADVGVWTGPLWLRPLNASDGELDLGEMWPVRWRDEHTDPWIAATMHSEYGATHRQSQKRLWLSTLDVPSPTARRLCVLEKVPGRVTVWIDGHVIGVWNRTDPDVADWWDRIFEQPDRTWYPRTTIQVGGPTAGTPDPSWSQSTKTLHALRIYVPEV